MTLFRDWKLHEVWPAVLTDGAFGGSWMYAQTGPFTRWLKGSACRLDTSSMECFQSQDYRPLTLKIPQGSQGLLNCSMTQSANRCPISFNSCCHTFPQAKLLFQIKGFKKEMFMQVVFVWAPLLGAALLAIMMRNPPFQERHNGRTANQSRQHIVLLFNYQLPPRKFWTWLLENGFSVTDLIVVSLHDCSRHACHVSNGRALDLQRALMCEICRQFHSHSSCAFPGDFS